MPKEGPGEGGGRKRKRDQERWDAWLEELKEFRREHGHCNVPQKHPGGLGMWVSRQRAARSEGMTWLDPCRVRKLEEEGFKWRVSKDERWDARFEELREFRREHGHCDVPQRHPGGLGNWVDNQRRARRHGTRFLDDRRIRKLEEEGFKWQIGQGRGGSSASHHGGSDVHDEKWETRFEELREFRRERGHFDVPRGFPGGLGNWVKRQRATQKEGSLDPHRVRTLEEAGFDWRSEEGKEDPSKRAEESNASQGGAGGPGGVPQPEPNSFSTHNSRVLDDPRRAGVEGPEIARSEYERQLTSLREELRDEHEGRISSLREELRGEHEGQLLSLREELRGEHEGKMSSLREELRGEHEGNMASLQEELRGEHEGKMALLREELYGEHERQRALLREELQREHEGRLASLREELRGEFAGLLGRAHDE